MLQVLIRITSHQGDSNEYPQHMHLWRTAQNYPSVIIKYPPYLFHCGTMHFLLNRMETGSGLCAIKVIFSMISLRNTCNGKLDI